MQPGDPHVGIDYPTRIAQTEAEVMAVGRGTPSMDRQRAFRVALALCRHGAKDGRALHAAPLNPPEQV
jgi:hypothetical protein